MHYQLGNYYWPFHSDSPKWLWAGQTKWTAVSLLTILGQNTKPVRFMLNIMNKETVKERQFFFFFFFFSFSKTVDWSEFYWNLESSWNRRSSYTAHSFLHLFSRMPLIFKHYWDIYMYTIKRRPVQITRQINKNNLASTCLNWDII